MKNKYLSRVLTLLLLPGLLLDPASAGGLIRPSIPLSTSFADKAMASRNLGGFTHFGKTANPPVVRLLASEDSELKEFLISQSRASWEPVKPHPLLLRERQPTLEELQETIQKESDRPDLLSALGIRLANSGRREEAIDVY